MTVVFVATWVLVNVSVIIVVPTMAIIIKIASLEVDGG
jgi:hypothetical protein